MPYLPLMLLIAVYKLLLPFLLKLRAASWNISFCDFLYSFRARAKLTWAEENNRSAFFRANGFCFIYFWIWILIPQSDL